MSEITDYLSGYLQELDQYMKRLNDNRLSRKDRKLFLEMGSEYYDIFKAQDGVGQENTTEKTSDFPEKLLNEIAAFNDNIFNMDEDGRKAANVHYGNITAAAGDYINTVKRVELMSEVLRKDAEISALQNEKIQMMQELVDFEISLYGEISETTTLLLEAENSEILNGRVRELWPYEQFELFEQQKNSVHKEEKTAKSPEQENQADAGAQEKGEQEKPFEKGSTEKDAGQSKQPPAFKAIYYEGSKPKVIYGAFKEEAVKRTAEKNPQCGKSDRCYVQQWDKGTRTYQQEGIYLIASGRDVTPVELKFPYMSSSGFAEAVNEIKELGAKYNTTKKMWYVERGTGTETINRINECLSGHDEAVYLKLPSVKNAEQFKAVTRQIKQDGGRYNPDKKAWYITEKEDKSKFQAYLPSNKNSVHNKLSHYKTDAQKQQADNRDFRDSKRDVPVHA